MKITRITVTASRKFNHPFESYANFGFSVTMDAAVEDHEAPAAMEHLRHLVEQTAEGHKKQILEEVEFERHRNAIKESITRLQKSPERIASLQVKIAEEEALDAESQDQYDLKVWRQNLQSLANWETELAEAEARLAAVPLPRLLLEPEIHPGHPDHPATDESFGE